jgi:hypothetical protein
MNDSRPSHPTLPRSLNSNGPTTLAVSIRSSRTNAGVRSGRAFQTFWKSPTCFAEVDAAGPIHSAGPCAWYRETAYRDQENWVFASNSRRPGRSAGSNRYGCRPSCAITSSRWSSDSASTSESLGTFRRTDSTLLHANGEDMKVGWCRNYCGMVRRSQGRRISWVLRWYPGRGIR